MNYLEIKGFKSIKHARIHLAPINIFIGANGSGKSNFVSFFDFLNSLYHRKLSEYIALRGGDNKYLHKGKKNTDTISFQMEFDNGHTGYAVQLKSGTDGFVFIKENLILNGVEEDISRLGTEAQLKSIDDERAKYIFKYLNGFRKYHFHDTSANSPFSRYSNIENDTYYFYEDGMNLASFIYNIHETNKIVYSRIIKNIQSIAPYFSDFYLVPNKLGNIKLQWRDKYSDVIFGPNDLSDGTLRFIALSVLFLQPALPNTIIIDEPELGLHPTAIAKLSGMIQSAADKGCQVIVATQSTDLIGHFLPEDIITVDQIDGETIFNRLSTENLNQWLEDYTIDDLWKRKIITGGQPNYSL